MILNCEKCHTRYILASHMLGYEGRKVRCTHCGHEWFQEKADDSRDTDEADATDEMDDSAAGSANSDQNQGQNEDEDGDEDEDNPFQALLQKMNEEHGDKSSEDDKPLTEDKDQVFSLSDRDDEESEEYPPVPEGILPEEAAEKPDAVSGRARIYASIKKLPEKIRAMSVDWSVAAGGVLLILVITLSIVLFILFHQPIVRALPATASIYNMLGIEISVAGEGLVFENVSAVSRPDKDGVNKLQIEGEIVNLSPDTGVIPKLGASLLREDSTVADLWVFRAEAKTIAPDGRAGFSTVYPQTADDIKEVNIHFVLR